MRVRTLDSLRGLAALMVVLYHWNLAFPAPNWKSGLVMHADFWLHGASWLRLIFRLAFLGPAAVLVFFVLSGFVLALSLRRPEETYGRFVIKRIFRIYPPYVFAVLLATALYFLAMPHSIPQLSDWFNNAGWTVRPTWSLVFGHLAMLGTQRFQSLDPPIWSLVHEMRISLLFPIIAYCVSRSWKTSLALSLMASMAGMALTPKVPELAASWLQTVQYSVLFFAGAALCERRAALQSRLLGLTPAARTALWAATFLLLEIPAGWLSGWTTYLTGSGAVLAVALCFAAPEAEKPLDRPLPRYLGKISYSLYLVHRPISLVVLHLGYGLIPTGMLAGVGLALTFAVADLTNRLIEWPSQRLGRILSGDRKALPAPH